MEFFPVIARPHSVTFKRFCTGLLLLWVAACATAPPVQEMSDARQAIAAAREVDAQALAGEKLSEAEDLLDTAERYLEAGGSTNYWQARQAAVRAKEAAFEALLASRTAQDMNKAEGSE